MRIRVLLAVLLFAVVLPTSRGDGRANDQLAVSAAISLKDVLNEAAEMYQKQTGTAVTFSFGGSGELATQIQNGAPVDLFISAAHKQVDDLVKSGEVAKDTPQTIIARNALVLIVPADSKNPPQKFEDLADAKLAERIAIGDPKSVPAGQYAMQVFDSLKITDAVRARLVYAPNVRQVLAYVERGEVPAGIVYQTDAMTSADKVKIAAMAHEKLHQPIEYPAVAIANSEHAKAAADFVKFLQCDKAQAIFKAKGFITP